MGKLWDRITRKEPIKPATQEEINQLKLELEKAKLQVTISNLKKEIPKKGFAKLVSNFLNETPERRKARLDNIKRGFGK